MQVEDELGNFCVEMDAASPTSTYTDYRESVPSSTIIENLQENNMAEILYTQESYSEKFGLVNQFNYND